MSSKGFSKLVIAAGVILMVIGFSMDITVSTGYGRVANIHLASQQQMIMLLGGFTFLGGLILFGVARMKQTREDEAREVEAKNRRTDEMVQKGKEFASTASGLATTASDIALRSSESAIRIGKEAYAQGKGKFKVAGYAIGGLLIAFVIAGYYLDAQEKTRLADAAKAEAERMRMEEEYAKKEQERRLQFFKQAFGSGKFLGYSFGDKNLKELAAQLGRNDYKLGSTVQIRCSADQCNSLAGYSTLAPALESVQFEFCTSGNSAASGSDNAESYALTKIEFAYKKDADAKADFEKLKAESYHHRQIDAETIESVEYMPLLIWIARKRGQWDVCGN